MDFSDTGQGRLHIGSARWGPSSFRTWSARACGVVAPRGSPGPPRAPRCLLVEEAVPHCCPHWSPPTWGGHHPCGGQSGLGHHHLVTGSRVLTFAHVAEMGPQLCYCNVCLAGWSDYYLHVVSPAKVLLSWICDQRQQVFAEFSLSAAPGISILSTSMPKPGVFETEGHLESSPLGPSFIPRTQAGLQSSVDCVF